MKKRFLPVFFLLIIACLCACDKKEANDRENKNQYTLYRCSKYTELFSESLQGVHVSIVGLSEKGAVKFQLCESEGMSERAEILIASSDGKRQSVNVEVEQDKDIWGAGSIFGESDFALIQFDESTNQVWCEKRGVDGSIKDKVPLDDFPITEMGLPIEMLIDEAGYIHIDDYQVGLLGEKKTHYCAFSTQGKLIGKFDFDSNKFVGISFLNDGRVVYDTTEDIQESQNGDKSRKHYLKRINQESGEPELVCEFTEKIAKEQEPVYAIGLYDTEKLVYMDNEGIFLSDYSMNNSEKIFDWISAGLGISEPFGERYQIFADKEGNICSTIRNMSDAFVEIKKVTEDVTEVKFAIPKYSKAYSKAVAEFNMKYPQYRISLEEYDREAKTALLTKIAAGDIPALIDAELVPFEDNTDYWLPLESIVDKETLDELNEFAIKLGSVDGKLYGAVSGFNIDTMVTYKDMDCLDYDSFINAAESDSELQTLIGMRYFGNMSEYTLASVVFNDEGGYSYYLSPDNPNNVVNEDNLLRVLNLVEKYPSNAVNNDEVIDALKDGRLFGMEEFISSERVLAEIYSLYGQDIRITGYPGKNGGKSFIQSAGTLLVSRTASEEEKDIAAKFIKILLSYDNQKYVSESGNPAFSIRKDVLDEGLEGLKRLEGSKFGDLDNPCVIEKIDISRAKEDMYNLLKTCEVRSSTEDEYMEILEEELDLFFQEGITKEELIKRLNSRLGIYFKEKSK